MKKLPLICSLVCAALCLSALGFLGYRYLNLDSRYQNLQKDNSSMNAQLKEKDEYIIGQTEQITELSDQLASLTADGESETEDDTEQTTTGYTSKNDPYPDLYAAKDGSTPKNREKYVYLTFDDGPSDLTPKVLDLLDEYDARATFFVVCNKNEENAKYLSEIVDRGHTLALHSYSHNYSQIYRSVDAFLSDYEKVYNWVYEETGYSPSLFRFPGGSNKPSSSVGNGIIAEMERRGFTYYDWNVSSGDGSNLTTTENIIDNICSNIDNVENPVVLMHDGTGKDATLKALPAVLKNLSDAGYEFRALTDTSTPVQYR